MLIDTDYRKTLVTEFERRRLNNSLYSRRAFAKDLNISPAQMTEIFNKKNGISPKKAIEVSKKLKLNSLEEKIFCNQVIASHSRSLKNRKQALEELKSNKFTLNLQLFEIVADEIHFLILELTYLDQFQSSISWIAKNINRTEKEVERAIKTLVKLELLSVENGVYKAVDDFTFSSDGVPSRIIQAYHQRILNHASRAITEQTIEKRDLSSLIMSINHEQLPEAKEDIRKFLSEFSKKYAIEQKSKNDVYNISIQLFSLLNEEGENND